MSMLTHGRLCAALLLIVLPATAASPESDELIKQARLAANKGDADGADALLKKATADAPGEANMLRGNVYAFLKKDVKQGVEFYKKAIEADPTRWEAFYFMGRVLAPDAPHEAADALEAAAKLAPKNPAIVQELGGIYARSGNWERAASALRRAAAINVHNSFMHLLGLAQTLLKAGRPLDALLTYREAAELHPWHAQPMVELMQVIFKLDPENGDYAAAVSAAAAAQAGAADADSGVADSEDVKAALEGFPTGAASACDLADAVSTLSPASLASFSSLRELCARKASSGTDAPRDEAPSPISARALKAGACASLLGYEALARRVIERVTTEVRCVVKLGAETVALRGSRGDGGHGVLVPQGIEMLIQGEGEDVTSLDAGYMSRHFLVAGGGKLRLIGVSLKGGRALLGGGGSVMVLPGATLEAADSSFVRNRALLGSGGAIAARGAIVILSRVVFEANEASWRGGAISLVSTNVTELDEDDAVTGLASAQLVEVTFEGNTANRGADDAALSGGSRLTPVPQDRDASVEVTPTGADGVAASAAAAVSDGSRQEHRLVLSAGSMTGLECAQAHHPMPPAACTLCGRSHALSSPLDGRHAQVRVRVSRANGDQRSGADGRQAHGRGEPR